MGSHLAVLTAHSRLCARITSGGTSWWDHVLSCWGSNTGWPCARHALSPLYSLSRPTIFVEGPQPQDLCCSTPRLASRLESSSGPHLMCPPRSAAASQPWSDWLLFLTLRPGSECMHVRRQLLAESVGSCLQKKGPAPITCLGAKAPRGGLDHSEAT